MTYNLEKTNPLAPPRVKVLVVYKARKPHTSEDSYSLRKIGFRINPIGYPLSDVSMDYYKEYISFKSIFYFCSLPIRVDSYKGCTYNCLYCFSQCLNNRNSTNFKKPTPANPLRFERLFASLNKRRNQSGVVFSCLKNRIPIHFGNVSDPFQPIENALKVSFDFLRILQRNNYPTVISTKSTLLASPDYLSLLKDFPTSVQVSFSTFNERLAKYIEPNAPSPYERLKLLEKLSYSGIWTVARIQPFLFPIERIYDIPFTTISDSGVRHVILEHLRIPTNSSLMSREKLNNVLGINILDTYKKLGIHNSRVNYELSSSIKLENILLAKEEINKNGMTFGSADNDFHHISDLPCCCGLPNTSDFQNYYSGNIGFSIFQSMRKGKVSFDNIFTDWQPTGSIREYLNSDCRLTSRIKPIDYLKSKIENPESSNSPTSFMGISFNENNGYIINKEFRKLFFRN